MPRTKKDARILNIKLSSPIYDKLDAFCEESGMSKTVATEKIFDQFFEVPETERSVFYALKGRQKGE